MYIAGLTRSIGAVEARRVKYAGPSSSRASEADSGASLLFDRSAHGTQMLAEGQGRVLAPPGEVLVELHLSAQGDAGADLLGLVPFSVADRCRG